MTQGAGSTRLVNSMKQSMVGLTRYGRSFAEIQRLQNSIIKTFEYPGWRRYWTLSLYTLTIFLLSLQPSSSPSLPYPTHLRSNTGNPLEQESPLAVATPHSTASAQKTQPLPSITGIVVKVKPDCEDVIITICNYVAANHPISVNRPKNKCNGWILIPPNRGPVNHQKCVAGFQSITETCMLVDDTSVGGDNKARKDQ